MSDINNGDQPAFPNNHPSRTEPTGIEGWTRHIPGNDPGMTLRQYAAIKLRVPNSGDAWLDEMIQESLRDELAARAMQGFAADPNYRMHEISDLGVGAYIWADSMLAARKEKQ